MAMSILLVSDASFPPLRSNPLAEAMAREATWKKEGEQSS